MNKFFTILFLSAVLIFQISCAKVDSNSNVNASPTPANVANTNVNQANTKVESTPLPQYTDAETALTDGNRFFDENETDKAIEAYSQAVKLNPELGEAYFKLGISYAIREKVSETEAIIVEETPTPTPKKSKKEVEAPKKDSEKAFESAVKAFKKVLAKNPKDDVAQFYLGRSLDKLNEDPDSLKALREAVKLKPDNSEYQTELGKILIKLAQYDEAVRTLKKALELDENNMLAEEQLEKAEAGKQRIDFAKKENEKRNDNTRDVRIEDRNRTVVTNKSNTNPTPKPNANLGKQGNTNQ